MAIVQSEFFFLILGVWIACGLMVRGGKLVLNDGKMILSKGSFMMIKVSYDDQRFSEDESKKAKFQKSIKKKKISFCFVLFSISFVFKRWWKRKRRQETEESGEVTYVQWVGALKLGANSWYLQLAVLVCWPWCCFWQIPILWSAACPDQNERPAVINITPQ